MLGGASLAALTARFLLVRIGSSFGQAGATRFIRGHFWTMVSLPAPWPTRSRNTQGLVPSGSLNASRATMPEASIGNEAHPIGNTIKP